MRGPLDLTRELLAAEVLHEIVHLPRRIDHAVELPEVLGLPASACLTVRLYDASGALLAAFVPPGATPATSALALASGAAAVRALPPARVSAVTDCHPALVPPVGLPASVAVVADAYVRGQEVVFAPTGDGGTALKIRAADLLALTGAAVAPLVEPGPYDMTHGGDGGWRADPFAAHFQRR